MSNYLCIDGGGTDVKWGVIDQSARILEQGKYPTPVDDYEMFLSRIEELYRKYDDIRGIALSLPGIIDIKNGYMHTGGGIVCLEEKNIVRDVSDRCDQVPVTVENDAKAAAYAEVVDGALKDCKNGIVIVVGTGLGGTVIINRQIVHGAHMFSGELSYCFYSREHLDDLVTGELPLYSKYGVDSFFFKRCTPNRMNELYAEYTGKPLEEISNPWLFEQARKKDENAVKAIKTCCKDFALLIFNLQCVIDPEVIAIGGGISNEDDYIDMLRAEVNKYAEKLVVVPAPQLRPCKFRSNANLLGAYYIHRDRMDKTALSGDRQIGREGNAE